MSFMNQSHHSQFSGSNHMLLFQSLSLHHGYYSHHISIMNEARHALFACRSNLVLIYHYCYVIVIIYRCTHVYESRQAQFPGSKHVLIFHCYYYYYFLFMYTHD